VRRCLALADEQSKRVCVMIATMVNCTWMFHRMAIKRLEEGMTKLSLLKCANGRFGARVYGEL
jgi:hypothetical protein